MPQTPAALLQARLQLRRWTGRALAGLRTATYIRKWLILGTIIGVVAGLGALVFYTVLQTATHWLLDVAGGYAPPTTAGEPGGPAHIGFHRRWTVPLIVAMGGLLSGILVFRFAPEAEGHGTDAAIEAVHTNPKGMRPRATVVKIVASALTIGSGGSGGREGPTAQISASFGSVLARALNLTPADARLAVSTGIASGIAAIFRAPLGGAILGAELLYRDDVETEALIPSVVASVVAFAIFGSVYGFTPVFGYHSGYLFDHPVQLAWFALLGIAAGLIGRLYAVSFYRTVAANHRIALPAWLKPGIAGLAVGLLGLAVPAVLGTGYGQVQQEFAVDTLLHMPLWLVLVLPFAKIVATSLSIGSGGSGGIFGPGMVIGGATGAALWRLFAPLHLGLPASPAPFVIVGMIACFGAIAHAPLATMLMVAEMTGNLALLAPGMVAIALAVLVVGDITVYRSQLRSRADSPAHRFSFGLPLSAAVPIGDVMAKPRLVLPASTSVADAVARLAELDLPGAPVVNSSGSFLGSVQRPTLAEHAAKEPDRPVGRVADPQAMTVPADAALDAGIEALATSRGAWVPVLDSDMAVVGIIGTGDLVRGYRLALRQSIRRLGRAAKGTVLVEEQLGAESPAVGARIADLPLPPATVVVAVLRRNNLHFAGPDTVLEAGDLVSILTRAGSEHELRHRLGAQPPVPPPSVSDTALV